MSLIVRRKITEAVTAYLKANAATVGVAADNIVSAYSQSERPSPALVVAAMGYQADTSLKQVGTVNLAIQYHAPGTVDGTERDDADTVLEKVHNFLMQPVDNDAAWSDANPEAGAIMAALNKPASGPDDREVTPLHIYDITPSEDNGDIVEEGWIDELVYDVLCQPMDSH